MPIMKLQANGSNLRIKGPFNLVATQNNYDSCEFIFDSLWDGYAKTAIFYSDTTSKKSIGLVDNKCVIPWENLVNDGILFIGVFGVNGTSVLPTNFVEHILTPGSYIGADPTQPTQDIYIQLIGDMNTFRNEEAVRVTAENERILKNSTIPYYKYKTQAEYEALSQAEKDDTNIIYEITDDDGVFPTELQTMVSNANAAADRINTASATLETETVNLITQKTTEIDTAKTDLIALKTTEIDQAKNDLIAQKSIEIDNAKDAKILEIDDEFQAKYDGLETQYATDLTEVKSSLASIRNYLDTPIATYTHSGNKEVVISAVDVNTNTFTSVGHGLLNGEGVYPALKPGTPNCYLKDKYPGGISSIGYPGYFVGDVTVDTFKLYSDSARTTIIDLIENAHMDLNAFVFVKPLSGVFNYLITNLPNMKKCKVVITGATCRKGDPIVVKPNGFASDVWFKSGGGGIIGYFDTSYSGDMFVNVIVEINTADYATVKSSGMTISSDTIISNKTTNVSSLFSSLNYRDVEFNSLSVSVGLLNGGKIEVYKL